jgi:3-dehydroquinate dehydratase-2
MRVLVIHGPNLNLLGVREPDVYGGVTLPQIDAGLHALADQLNVSIETFQSNQEGDIVDRIHAALNNVDGILINPGAFTHTSVSIRDALLATGIPFIEAHLSNIHGREEFRRHSMLADVAMGVICGFGSLSYDLGLRALVANR